MAGIALLGYFYEANDNCIQECIDCYENIDCIELNYSISVYLHKADLHSHSWGVSLYIWE